jgi:hypothetical protein
MLLKEEKRRFIRIKQLNKFMVSSKPGMFPITFAFRGDIENPYKGKNGRDYSSYDALRDANNDWFALMLRNRSLHETIFSSETILNRCPKQHL